MQHKAARFVHGDYRRRAIPTHMLNALGWKTLQARRRDTTTSANVQYYPWIITWKSECGGRRSNKTKPSFQISSHRSGYSTTPWFVCRPQSHQQRQRHSTRSCQLDALTANKFLVSYVYSKRMPLQTARQVTQTGGIFYFPWHRHQIEGTNGVLLSPPKDTEINNLYCWEPGF